MVEYCQNTEEKKNLIRLGGSTTFFKKKIVNPVKKDKNGIKQVDNRKLIKRNYTRLLKTIGGMIVFGITRSARCFT